MKRSLGRADVLALGVLVAVVATLTVHWAPHTFWSPDALVYQTRVEQIRGASEEEALSRVWQGPLAEGFRSGDARRAPADRALADPDWIPYMYELFQRRLLVPLFAAALHPIASTESLEVVAIIGMFAFALLLYVLLRQRFSPLACAIAITLCLAWPPIFWAFMPLTESWGLALLCAALLAALVGIERGRKWLWAWAAIMLVLSFTRDFTPVALAAVGVVALTLRNRRSIELVGTGVLAALPAPLISGGGSPREHLAFALNGARIPEDSSWGFIIDGYLPAIWRTLRDNVEYLFASEPRFLEAGLPLFPLTLPILAGIVMVILARGGFPGDSFLPLMRGALLGGVAYILVLPLLNYLRFELVLLPVAAAGLAMGIDLLRRWAAARRPAAAAVQ